MNGMRNLPKIAQHEPPSQRGQGFVHQNRYRPPRKIVPWSELYRKVQMGIELNPIERFVYLHEPHRCDDNLWDLALFEALMYAQKQSDVKQLKGTKAPAGRAANMQKRGNGKTASMPTPEKRKAYNSVAHK